MASQSQQDGKAQSSLPEQLRAATRQKHHALNTQIIARLSLSLPPNANTSVNYAKGMTVFGQIYFAFENFLAISLASGRLNRRLLEQYERIYLPRLLRTSRLRNDIDMLKSRLRQSEIEELEDVAEASRAFCLRVESSLSTRPHILLAYAWTMYLALFNGGRWIQKQLFSAGNAFWQGEVLPLSFWEFEEIEHPQGDEGQLKDAFKDGFLEAASHLTDDERRDVIQETIRLFDLCSEMVGFLDRSTTMTATTLPDDVCPVSRSPVNSARAKSHIGAYVVAETIW